MTDKAGWVAVGLAGAVVSGLVVIIACAFGTIAGAFIGWVLMTVGIAPWVYDGLAQVGLHVTNLWQLGAALGFVGGFFKATVK